MKLGRRLLMNIALIVLACALAVTGWSLYNWQARMIKVGDVRIDPLATLNAERRYEVQVWLESMYLPRIRTEQHHAAVAAAIAELNEVYPNISVSVEYFPPGELTTRLDEAITAGVGPDLAGYTGPALIDVNRQIPIDPYLNEDARLDMTPAAEAAVRNNNHLWAWPRWLTFNVWVAHASFASGLPNTAPSAADLLEHAAAWRQNRGFPALAYNGYDPSLWYGVHVASFGRRFFTESGELDWDRDAVVASAAFLAELNRQGAISNRVADTSRSRLAAFWEGRAAIVAPANHLIVHHVLSRSGELTYDEDGGAAHAPQSQVALLTPPYTAEHWQGIPGEVAVYVALRREEHAGDDHTRAVMLVGEHLSRRLGLWEAVHLPAVPAHPTSLHKWEMAAGLRPEKAAQLIDWSGRLIAAPADRWAAHLQTQALTEVIAPLQVELLAGNLEPDEFADRMFRDLNALLSRYRQSEASAL